MKEQREALKSVGTVVATDVSPSTVLKRKVRVDLNDVVFESGKVTEIKR